MIKSYDLLVIGDGSLYSGEFRRLAKELEFNSLFVKGGQEALEAMAKNDIGVAVVDMELAGFSGVQLLEHVKSNKYDIEVIVVTGKNAVGVAQSSVKAGAYDYLVHPFDDMEKVKNCLARAREKAELARKLRQLEFISAAPERGGMVGRSSKIREVFSMIENISASNSSILILGESGTGKELVAKEIHAKSPRKNCPFVMVNCSALAENLLESELFGHKKGSFTGAIADKKGFFEVADKGTIFLDEIGEISQALQVKLLRAVQEGEVRPVGSTDNLKVDVRIIAATNQDLTKLVKQGRFREDLYYRLNVISIHLPPLRDRREDIPLLAYYFLKQFSEKMGKNVGKISVDAMQSLQEYRWPGNVRELENVIERAVVLTKEEVLTAKDLPRKILGDVFYKSDPKKDEREMANMLYKDAKDRAVAVFNRSYIATLLQQVGGNVSIAAERAGLDRSNFKKIIKKSGIDIKEFKKP